MYKLVKTLREFIFETIRDCDVGVYMLIATKTSEIFAMKNWTQEEKIGTRTKYLDQNLKLNL